ncbi:hypothetical protein [Bacteroides sp. 519]|uniref:hypothetical protein n=1 Tax=Bacteroides sp. 519 TaxID=2302937 RepID=UPI0013D1D4C9|nr:hypothetical protein [Bacteroides sp. 519]NDV58433.1 hypothetical protein [Bacteroides sp. 519]
MKKLLVAVVVFMGMGTAAFAQSADAVQKQEVVTLVTEDAFKEVKAEDLNEKVQATLATYNEAYTVKKLEYNEEKKITRVTLEAKENQTEKVVSLNEEGKEVE